MPDAALELAQLAAQTASGRKAEDVVILDVRDLTSVADYFVIASATSVVHLNALREGVSQRLKQAGGRLLGHEGAQGTRWVLLDYGDVVIHLFHHAEREYYDLERLWGDAPRIRVEGDDTGDGEAGEAGEAAKDLSQAGRGRRGGEETWLSTDCDSVTP